jgi:hypothetical protein
MDAVDVSNWETKSFASPLILL